MNNRGRIFLALAILILIALTTSQTITPAAAQSGAEYDPTLSQMFALPILTLASL